MKNQFSLYDLLILIGIIQGIIISVLLLKSKKNRISNKFLALGVLSFSFLSSKTLLQTLHLWDTNTFRYFPNGIELALPPLMYFYVKALVTPKFTFKKKDWLHFVPFFISQTFAFIVYFSVLKTTNFYEKDTIAKKFRFNDIKSLEEYLLLISLMIYLFYGYKKMKNYRIWLNNTISDNTFPDLGWLKNIFKIFVIIGVFSLINNSLDIFFDFKSKTVLHWNLLILFITVLIYYLGLQGYLQPDYTFNKNEIIVDENTPSHLPNDVFATIVKKLEKAMVVDKLFLNPKLTIYELSNKLKTPQRILSQAINQHFKISFRDFINEYRLEEVKSKLKNSNNSHMSILGIALDCGFNSEASFYRIFKKSTGISPKEFIQKNTK